MTDYEFFIEQDIKTIRKKLKEVGIRDYREIPKKSIDFIKKFSLDHDKKHNLVFSTMGGYSGSGELVILLNFQEDFGFGEIKIKQSVIKYYFSGTSSLKIRKELGGNDIIIKSDKCNFFDNNITSQRKIIFDNYSIYTTFGKSFSEFDTIKDLFDKLREYSIERKPIIEDLEESLKNGEFIKAYNSVNVDEFKVGEERFFLKRGWQKLIDYYFKYSYLGKKVTLEKAILLTIILHRNMNGISDQDKKNLESGNPHLAWNTLEQIYNKYHKNGQIINTKNFLKQVQLDYQIGILELKREISGKYGIDPSWILEDDETLPNYLPSKENLCDISMYDCEEFSMQNAPLEKTRKGIDEEIERLKKLKEGN